MIILIYVLIIIIVNINPSDISFGYTIGKVINQSEYKKSFLAEIINYDEEFNEKIGLWIYFYNPPTVPIIKISLNNNDIEFTNTNNNKRSIIKLTDNTNDYDINVSNNIIDLSYVSDTSLSLLFQRGFYFNFNSIFNEIKVEVNEYTGFDGTSGNSDNNDISFFYINKF